MFDRAAYRQEEHLRALTEIGDDLYRRGEHDDGRRVLAHAISAADALPMMRAAWRRSNREWAKRFLAWITPSPQ